MTRRAIQTSGITGRIPSSESVSREYITIQSCPYYSHSYCYSRSPSPGAASYRGRERENFQISVKNEGYKRDSFEERPVRREERGDVRPRGSATRRPEMSR